MPHSTWNPQPPWLHSSDENESEAAFHLNVYYKTIETNRNFRKSKTNCRKIEIPVLYPLSHSTSLNKADDILGFGAEGLAYHNAGNKDSPMLTDTNELTTRAFQLPANQVQRNLPSSNSPSLLTLPLELRLEIYNYLLPPQTHTIITQYPSSGLYYSSTPEYSTQSLYPPTSFGFLATDQPNLTTYTIPRRETPIYPEILRVCKQTYEEAEPVLYSGKDVVFNFDTYLDAVLPFLQDRSTRAKESIRSIRIAMDIPMFFLIDSVYADVMVKNVTLTEAGRKLREILEVIVELKALRAVDMVAWGSFVKNADDSDSISPHVPLPANQTLVPTANVDTPSSMTNTSTTLAEPEVAWKTSDAELREVQWVRELLKMDVLQNIRTTWLNVGALKF